MTRETKVGLVVAGSFIVLVGVVVASKMRGGVEAPNPEVASTVTPGGEESELPEKKVGPPETATFPTPPKPLPDNLRPVAATELAPKEGGLPALPPFPPAVTGDLTPPLPSLPPALPGISDDDQKKALDALRMAKTPTPPPGLPALPGLPQDGGFPPLPGPDKFAQAKNALPPLPPIPGPPTSSPKVDGLPPIPPLPGPAATPKKVETPLPPAVFPAPGKGDLLPPPVVMKDPAPPVFPTPGKDVVPPPVVPAPPKKEVALPPLPPIDEGPFAKKTPTTPPAPPTLIGIAPPLPPVTERKEVPPPLGTGFTASPPVGIAPPVPTTPSTLPKVTTVDIPPYVLRAEDRDLAAVSQHVYGTDRYAQALLAFNRDHPLSKEDIRKSPPRLVKGQMLYIPPPELLQGKYAALISPEGRPVIGALGSDVPPVKIGSAAPPPAFPPPIGTPPIGEVAREVPPVRIKSPTAGTPVSIGVPAGGAPTPGKSELTKSFIVAGAGSHIIQIAQQTLGDSRRWPEIYRLNPSIQPQNVIPGGTQIRLPMDARVP